MTEQIDRPGVRRKRRQGVPLYERSAERLKELIKSGEMGDTLPSQDTLCQTLQVSRATVREAIRLLEQAGLVSVQQGIGTFVRRPMPHLCPGLEEFISTTDLIIRNGYAPGTSYCEVRLVMGTRVAYRAFAGQPVIIIERVRTADGVPLVYSEDVLPDRGYDPAAVRIAVGEASLLSWLDAQGIQPAYAKTSLTAENADRVLSQRLGVPRGTALLHMEEVAYDRDDSLISAAHDFYRCDLTQFHVLRRRL